MDTLDKDKLRFECQMSGNCCHSRGEYGFVYLSNTDRKRMARHFGLSLKEFTENYCDRTDGLYHLIELKTQTDCVFLEEKKCLIYEARPTQCRTWPFWPENMNSKSWNESLRKDCPGIGKGRTWPRSEVQKNLDDQEFAESDIN